ncbi:restriction endonuclease subunit S [Salmonella enterica]|nr:restriction endonuclease subunit S [Salmonella enterica]
MSQYRAYPAYKDSGVEWIGQVPEHWKIAQIKRISALNPRKSTLSEEKDSLCSFLPMEKLRTNAVTLDETRPIHEVYGGYSYFCDGDILIAKVTPCFENGNIAVANGLVNGIGFGSTEINVLRVNGKGHNRFLYYRLQEEQFRTIAKSEMRGTGGLKRVPTDLFESFTIGLPDTDEQASIAATLDRETARIDALVEKKTRFIELLKEKRQALITHAVTKGLDRNAKMKDSGVEWIGQVPEHWEATKLKHVAAFSGGGTPSKENPDYWNGCIPWVSPKDMKHEVITDSIDHITTKGLENSATKLIDSGAVLLVARSGILRHTIPVGINNVPVSLNQDMKALSLDETRVRPRFILRWVQGLNRSLLGIWAKEGATVESLEHEYVANTRLPLPDLKEQDAILATLDLETARIDALISKAEQSITLLKERRAAFITAAVTGQIDLRGKQ